MRTKVTQGNFAGVAAAISRKGCLVKGAGTRVATATAPKGDFCLEGVQFWLTDCVIRIFYVFRDKRISPMRGAGVLPGSRHGGQGAGNGEPIRSELMDRACRVPERTVIFDSLVLSSRHDTDVRLRHLATA